MRLSIIPPIFLFACLIAQPVSAHGEIIPEIFPSVTPLPIKPPLPIPTPESTVSPEASPLPSATPLPSTTPRPSATPYFGNKGQLEFSLSKVQEGQPSTFTLQLKGSVSFPVKGWIRYEDKSYDYAQKSKEAIPFVLTSSQPHKVNVIFRSTGRKTVKIETDASSTRNLALQVQPLAATIFPRSVDLSAFDRDPSQWRVWVNLHHSLNAGSPQRQYYMVTYKGQILQKLLTSSAAPGRLTPEGSFKLGVKIASPKSTIYDSIMPFWTTILVPGHSFEYGNHGLTGENYLYSLGVPASHGCLRLSNKWIQKQGDWVNIGAAKWVYSFVPVGTPIKIFRRAAQPFAYENYAMWIKKKK